MELCVKSIEVVRKQHSKLKSASTKKMACELWIFLHGKGYWKENWNNREPLSL